MESFESGPEKSKYDPEQIRRDRNIRGERDEDVFYKENLAAEYDIDPQRIPPGGGVKEAEEHVKYVTEVAEYGFSNEDIRKQLSRTDSAEDEL